MSNSIRRYQAPGTAVADWLSAFLRAEGLSEERWRAGGGEPESATAVVANECNGPGYCFNACGANFDCVRVECAAAKQVCFCRVFSAGVQLSRGRAASDSLALGWPRRGRRNFLLLLRAPPISLSLSLSLTAPRSACGELSCSFAIAASTLLGAFLSAGAAATRSRRGAAPPRPKERLCALSRLAPPPQRLLLLLSCWRPVTTSSLLDGRALSTIASALFGGGGGGGRGEAATPSSCFFGGALSRRDAVAERRVLLH